MIDNNKIEWPNSPWKLELYIILWGWMLRASYQMKRLNAGDPASLATAVKQDSTSWLDIWLDRGGKAVLLEMCVLGKMGGWESIIFH